MDDGISGVVFGGFTLGSAQAHKRLFTVIENMLSLK